MKIISWKYVVALAVVVGAVGAALRHLLLVGKPVTFFDYFVLDVAFLPLQVLLVSVIIERILAEREKQAMLKKMNMVIGAFFSEVGTELLRKMNGFCVQSDELRARFDVSPKWREPDFAKAVNYSCELNVKFEPAHEDFVDLTEFLRSKMTFILGLLQNPNLLEHESFTNLLWAVTHLVEELLARDDLATMPDADRAHLRGDVSRACGLLVREWLQYMEHLRVAYPYVYSLSIRTNPFKPEAKATIEQWQRPPDAKTK